MMGFPEPSETRDLRLSLASDLQQVRHAAFAVRQFLSLQGCDDESLMACELALVEACNNAIQHAPPTAKDKPVFVEAICESSRVELRVTDHTGGFDWPDHVELPCASNESGRGLFLIQSLMNSAAYFRSAGENVLVLRKTRIQAASSSSESPGTMRTMPNTDILSRSEVTTPKAPARNGLVTLESEIAGAIQRAFLLDHLPELPGVELAQRKMTIACAGHCPLLLKPEGREGIKTYSPDGMPLGILPDSTFADVVVELAENSLVLIYTDGITEAINSAGERYGQARLMDWLQRTGSAPPMAEELKQELVSDLKQFRNGTALADDQTFLIAVARPSLAVTQLSLSVAGNRAST